MWRKLYIRTDMYISADVLSREPRLFTQNAYIFKVDLDLLCWTCDHILGSVPFKCKLKYPTSPQLRVLF